MSLWMVPVGLVIVLAISRYLKHKEDEVTQRARDSRRRKDH